MAIRPRAGGIRCSLSLHGLLAVLAVNLGMQEGLRRLIQTVNEFHEAQQAEKK